jgi:[ribosomal protein S5]-alanine N-acetyltransferase
MPEQTQQNSQHDVKPFTITTDRLLLRPFSRDDIPALLPLIGAREVAATTLRIPHPYSAEDAEAFLRHTEEVREKGTGVRCGIFLKHDATLCGGIGLVSNLEHHHAELGYWLGVPFWGKGYCTEAAQAVVSFGFEVLNLHRIHAGHFSSNPASGRVLRKLGMKHEGVLRQHICKWGDYIDVETYALLASEYESLKKRAH